MSVPEVPESNGETGNTKLVSPAKKWCFTLNNYSENDIKYLIEKSASFGCIVFETEVGDEGTPHLQGFVKFHNKKRPLSVYTETDAIHWESAKGTEIDSWFYCTEDYRAEKPWARIYHNKYPTFEKWLKEILLSQKTLGQKRIPSCKYKYSELKPHQKDVVDLVLHTEPDDRTIHVWWSKEFGTGKTITMRYLLINHPELVLQIPSGKSSDIINTIIQADMDRVKAVVINLVGADSEGYPIEALEQIKDACVACGKYKGGAKVFDYVHVIIFANKPPERQIFKVMDENRWKITEVGV